MSPGKYGDSKGVIRVDTEDSKGVTLKTPF